MSKLSSLFSHDGCKTLRDFYDRSVIAHYCEDFDLTPIEKLLRSSDELSPIMRNFIADLLTGKIKRKKASTLARDLDIYLYVNDLLEKNIPLISNIKGDGNTAVSIAAEKFFPGLDKAATVLKAYQRIQKELTEPEIK